MDRRTIVTASLAAGTGLAASAQARGQGATMRALNVVLVQGLFADGSCWSDVIGPLQAAGLDVTVVQNLLTTLDEAADADPRSFGGRIRTDVARSRPTLARAIDIDQRPSL